MTTLMFYYSIHTFVNLVYFSDNEIMYTNYFSVSDRIEVPLFFSLSRHPTNFSKDIKFDSTYVTVESRTRGYS